jgi:hypothetical protein
MKLVEHKKVICADGDLFFLLDFNLKSILKQLKNRFLYMCVLHMSHILQICQLFQNTCDIIICTTLARLLMENNKDVICVEHNMCYICKNKFAVKTLHLFSEGRVFSWLGLSCLMPPSKKVILILSVYST